MINTWIWSPYFDSTNPNQLSKPGIKDYEEADHYTLKLITAVQLITEHY